jgi:hypothetical protein
MASKHCSFGWQRKSIIISAKARWANWWTASSEFTNYRARAIEKALDLPRGCLDLPRWHFEAHMELLWQHAQRAADDRAWFDSLLKCLLDVPASAPEQKVQGAGPATRAVLEKLRGKAAAN